MLPVVIAVAFVVQFVGAPARLFAGALVAEKAMPCARAARASAAEKLVLFELLGILRQSRLLRVHPACEATGPFS